MRKFAVRKRRLIGDASAVRRLIKIYTIGCVIKPLSSAVSPSPALVPSVFQCRTRLFTTDDDASPVNGTRWRNYSGRIYTGINYGPRVDDL